MAKDQRFIIKDRKGVLFGTRIITDTETGVQYLWVAEGYGGGLTVLLDRDGKPLIDEQYRSPGSDERVQ
ncbi:MAG: DUF6440 family protein [Clostridiales bacterium]|jgi:hypothetical protein|nr:DUF6440 family protein [Clostridiales bacterium]